MRTRRRVVVAAGVAVLTAALLTAALLMAAGDRRGTPEPGPLRVRLVTVVHGPDGEVGLRLAGGHAGPPGTLVALEGASWPAGRESVSFGPLRPPVLWAAEGRLVVAVPPLPPGPARITAPGRSGARSAIFTVQAPDRRGGPAGQATERYLDLVEGMLDEVAGICGGGTCAPPPAGSRPRVVFVLDASTSMDDGDLGRPRIEVARATLLALLDTMEEVSRRASAHFATPLLFEVGLVPFAAQPLALFTAAPSTDWEDLRAKVAALETGPGTAIGPAVTEAARLLGPAGGVQLILGDGGDNGLDAGPSPLEAAARAAAAGSVVHTVGFGAPGDMDENLLREMARAGGGTYRRAAGAGDLAGAFQDLFFRLVADHVVAGGVDGAGAAVRRAAEHVRPPHPAGAAEALAMARDLVGRLGAGRLRALDGVLSASQLPDGLAWAGQPAGQRAGEGPGRAGGGMVACDDVDRRVGRVLTEGAAQLAADVALPGWGAGVGWGMDVALGLPEPLWFDLGRHLDDALAAWAWGARVVEASGLAAGCIDAIAAGLAGG